MPFFNLTQYEPESTLSRFVLDPSLLPTREESMERLRLLKQTLLKASTSSLDIFVHNASKDVASKIDCTACANCCKTLEPDLDQTEITTLALHTNCSEEIFMERYTKRDLASQQHFISTKPCVFLTNNLCDVYSSRPKSCSTFPHLDEPGIKFRLTRVLALYHVCPIVYNTIERVRESVEQNVTASST